MQSKIQRIGILTGGGDCPGLNAVLRAVTKAAIHEHDVQVVGIEDGFAGLIENQMIDLTHREVSGILTRGGSILGCSNRANPSRYCTGTDADGQPIFEDVTDRCLDHIDSNNLDALIVIGGDGTMSCAAPLVERGVNIIGVPKTIDNDIVGTEITFGFLTAYEIATRSLDRLHSTAASHSRVMVCEVMGRNAGWIALYAGTASGSDVILMPEIPFDIDIVARYCEHRAKDRHGFTIICCSEGARPRGGDQSIADHDPRYVEPRLGGIGESVAAQIQDRTGIETRTTVLGHVQRGGTPVAADRVLATRFGHHALQLLMSGETGRMVVRQNGAHTHINILDCAHRQRLVDADNELVSAARAVRTCFGDSR